MEIPIDVWKLILKNYRAWQLMKLTCKYFMSLDDFHQFRLIEFHNTTGCIDYKNYIKCLLDFSYVISHVRGHHILASYYIRKHTPGVIYIFDVNNIQLCRLDCSPDYDGESNCSFNDKEAILRDCIVNNSRDMLFLLKRYFYDNLPELYSYFKFEF